MTRTIRLAAFMITGTAAATIAHPALAASYQYTTLTNSAAPSDFIEPFGINDNNVVVGLELEYGKAATGFVWRNGSVQPVDKVVDFSGINDNGIAVGGIRNSTGRPEIGFYNVADGSLTTGTIKLPKSSSNGGAINIGGDVAGGTYRQHKRGDLSWAYRFSASGKTTPLNPKGQTYCGAYDINDNGDVVANCQDYVLNSTAYLYSKGKYTTLTFPGSTSTQADFITNDGVIGGQAVVGPAYVGFTYAGGTYTTVVPTMANVNAYTTVLRMLKNGNLIGNFVDTADVQHGFLYDAAAKKYYQLDVPGAVFMEIEYVSPTGSFVGYYNTSTSGPGIGFVATCAAGKSCN